MKLGQLLLQRGLIDREQLGAALRRQSRTDHALGEVLLDMGIVSRSDIVSALRSQPQASVDEYTLRRVEPEVRATLSTGTGARLRAMAVATNGDLLVVAMADPTDTQAIEILRRETGRQVIAVAADPDVLGSLLRPEADQAGQR